MPYRGGGKPGNKNAEKWTEAKALQVAKDLRAWLNKKHTNIHINEFLLMENEYSINLISKLRKKFQSFDEQIKDCKEIMKIKKLKWGQLGKLNPAVTIFDLKVNHNMIESKEEIINQNVNISQKAPKIIFKDDE